MRPWRERPAFTSFTYQMTSRTVLTALFLATTGWALPAVAEPLPGLWERRFTAFMADPVSGVEKPWAEPADTRCLTDAELRTLPFLTAASSKASYEAEGGSCTVSDEARTRQGASWSLRCKEKSGDSAEMRMSSEIADTLIVSTTRTATRDKAPGALDVRAEVRMARLGSCDGGAAKTGAQTQIR